MTGKNKGRTIVRRTDKRSTENVEQIKIIVESLTCPACNGTVSSDRVCSGTVPQELDPVFTTDAFDVTLLVCCHGCVPSCAEWRNEEGKVDFGLHLGIGRACYFDEKAWAILKLLIESA